MLHSDEKIEIWEKIVRMRIYSLLLHTYTMYMQQKTMSMPALLRLLEAIAVHKTRYGYVYDLTYSQIFQVRRDAVLATSKLLLENSNY